MKRNQAHFNQRRNVKRMHFIALMAQIVAMTGFNGHYSNKYIGTGFYNPTRSQIVKNKILRARA